MHLQGEFKRQKSALDSKEARLEALDSRIQTLEADLSGHTQESSGKLLPILHSRASWMDHHHCSRTNLALTTRYLGLLPAFLSCNAAQSMQKGLILRFSQGGHVPRRGPKRRDEIGFCMQAQQTAIPLKAVKKQRQGGMLLCMSGLRQKPHACCYRMEMARQSWP